MECVFLQSHPNEILSIGLAYFFVNPLARSRLSSNSICTIFPLGSSYLPRLLTCSHLQSSVPFSSTCTIFLSFQLLTQFENHPDFDKFIELLGEGWILFFCCCFLCFSSQHILNNALPFCSYVLFAFY